MTYDQQRQLIQWRCAFSLRYSTPQQSQNWVKSWGGEKKQVIFGTIFQIQVAFLTTAILYETKVLKAVNVSIPHSLLNYTVSVTAQ